MPVPSPVPVPDHPLTWTQTEAGEIPVSARFDDPYFSLAGGLAETAHVFHAGNDLPARFRPGFQVAELGLGTGLNLLATARLWQAAGLPGVLHYTAFEAYPLSPEQTAQALAPFAAVAGMLPAYLAGLRAGTGLFALGAMAVEIVAGDANRTLPLWQGRADAWFLDGFSPAKNPELWSAPLLAEVARHTAPGGSFATYTAAGEVRRALAAAGFAVERCPGYGRKRHMTRGRLGAC